MLGMQKQQLHSQDHLLQKHQHPSPLGQSRCKLILFLESDQKIGHSYWSHYQGYLEWPIFKLSTSDLIWREIWKLTTTVVDDPEPDSSIHVWFIFGSSPEIINARCKVRLWWGLLMMGRVSPWCLETMQTKTITEAVLKLDVVAF